jgi:transposase
MESMGNKPRRRRSFTPEFKAEIVDPCQQGDRSVGQVGSRPGRDRGPGMGQEAGCDTGTRQDGELTSTERQELAQAAAGEPQAA